jgi:transposase
MHVVHPGCGGLDGHQATLTACLRCLSDEGQITTAVREYGTTCRDLLALSDGLVEVSCPSVAMASTGVYWRPVYQVLRESVAVVVGTPQERRQRPGKKTDKAEARWLAAR